MAQVLNQSFKDWSSTRKFPFTEESDMTCQDGRRVPVSAFVMISLCPDIEGTAWISSMDKNGIRFTMSGNWAADASWGEYVDGWMPIMRAGNCVGTVMLSAEALAYLEGLAMVKELVFSEGHLELRPETVRGFCFTAPVLTTPPNINGYPATDLVVEYDSDRFSSSGDSVTVDTTPDVENETVRLKWIGGGRDVSADAAGFMTNVDASGNLTIRTPAWCDAQFHVSDDTLTFHQKES